MKNTFLNTVKDHTISCQARPRTPHSSFIMSRMALAAKEAAGIRANSVVDIQAIQDEAITAHWFKQSRPPDSPVYITQQRDEPLLRAVP